MTDTLAELLRTYRHDDAAFVPPYIIAEAGVNHEGSVDTAMHLVDLAAGAGADAIKFQTYRAETLAAVDSPAYWDLSKEPTRSQRELFAKYDALRPDDYTALARHCESVGIEFMSTPFDRDAVQMLAGLVGVFKVASADITNHPLLELIAAQRKPMLLSTGASTLSEIGAALDVIDGKVPVGLMHCILSYPTERSDANLGMIADLRRRYPECMPGYSDHTVPDKDMQALVTAVLVGARVIETHFTHDKTLPGNDHYHALDADDLRRLRERLLDVSTLVGENRKLPVGVEMPARRYARRSLVAAREIPAGSVLGPDDLTWKRPATGIGPEQIDVVIGMRARRTLESDTILQWAMLE